MSQMLSDVRDLMYAIVFKCLVNILSVISPQLFQSHFISFLVMPRKGNVFTRLEKLIGCIYPSFLKYVLLRSGFDCESALLLLNEDKINKIELDVAANPELLKNTVYENKNGEFKFLVGHRELILNIPETIRLAIRQKKEKPSEKNNEETQSDTRSDVDIDDLSEKLIKKIKYVFRKKKHRL